MLLVVYLCGAGGEGLCDVEDLQSASFTPVYNDAVGEGDGEDVEEEEREEEGAQQQAPLTAQSLSSPSAHSMEKVACSCLVLGPFNMEFALVSSHVCFLL